MPLHRITIEVDGDFDLQSLDGGQVNVGTGDIARQLTIQGVGDLSSLDPGDLLHTRVAAYYQEDGGTSEEVFFGAVVDVARSTNLFELIAHDLATFGLAPFKVYTPFTISTGTSLGSAVNRIAEEMGLTTSATSSRTLKRPLSVERGAEPWRVIKDLCTAAGRVVFFDRFGQLTIKRPPNSGASATWTVGDGRLLSDPKIHVTAEGYRTAAEVIGNQSCGDIVYGFSGSTTRPVALESIEAEDVEDDSDAASMASDALDDFSVVDVGAEFDIVPEPTAEPWDKVTVGSRDFIVDSFTVPLNGTGSMPMGAHKRIRRARRGRSL